MTITKRCCGVAGEAVGTRSFVLGADDAGAVAGGAETDGVDGEVAAGAEQATTSAATIDAWRRSRIE